ncbi:MAG: UDP-N-acetylmuramoyl-L-alanyl-D-glutamate--2,6-diaminopimelate ligase [Clostridiales bacterium]|nr:UDP-N-acetylmuramoyl-L-alanyl-D-glutamate--2,6-diaminopimelate ligase [Clostridiales bacterium]
MLLSKILADIEYTSNASSELIETLEIADITYDSRKATLDKLFVCLIGAVSDGHNYAAGAYGCGCRVFMVQRQLDSLPDDAVQIIVTDTRAALALASAALFDYPARSLLIIGITGTKGKTTTASLVYDILNAGGIATASIGTTGILINGVRTPTVNTTPESYELHKAFRKMVDDGISCVVMEVSSQAIYMRRTVGIHFHIGVFTNLSRDHIGGVEHPDFEHYMNCKAELFRQCRYGIFNADDAHFTDMVKNAHSINTTFGSANSPRDFAARDIRPWRSGNLLGVKFICRSVTGECEYSLRMPGEFNVYNALAAIAVAQRMQIRENVICDALSRATVRGRFELVTPEKGSGLEDVVTIIDYAHNAVSMRAALETIRKYQPKRLVVLFGSVGGRTQLRRSELGEVTGQLADFCIITSDNPNFEAPEDIIHDIEESVIKTSCPYAAFVDRRDAVRYAIDHALSGDCILFAGKGHEEYQLIEGEYRHYDEREEILTAVAARAARI